jgi:murein DD-endopeptidase MepM/ murein hydrolase activator NlpD
VPLRLLAALAVVAAAAGLVAASAPARATAAASAQAAVVSGTLGTVARVKASGDEATSRSAPSKTPPGIMLGGGTASASAVRGSGNATAIAQAEANDVELLGGAVTATLVRRVATDKGAGAVYTGAVEGLVVDGKEIAHPADGRRYDLGGKGSVVVGADGAGLRVTLTAALDAYPAGTSVVVADVSASATDGPAATPTPTPTPAATTTATATPTPTATPKPSKPKAPAYKKRLMSDTFQFPVRGKTVIGGPFGAFRADTGFHEGNDLFANFGTPVVAVADGTIENVGSLKISGNRLWVYADTGDRFFYAHLSAFAPDAVDHRHVTAGTLLGYVGNTGDAEPTPPHLHFEIHPDGGDAVDPHPFLVVWQRRAGNVGADTAARPGTLVELRDFIGTG